MPVGSEMISLGAIIAGGRLSIMVTDCVAFAALLAASIAVHVTTVGPSGNPEAGALFTLMIDWGGVTLSLTVGPPNVTFVNGPDAWAVIGGGGSMAGGLLSAVPLKISLT